MKMHFGPSDDSVFPSLNSDWSPYGLSTRASLFKGKLIFAMGLLVYEAFNLRSLFSVDDNATLDHKIESKNDNLRIFNVLWC